MDDRQWATFVAQAGIQADNTVKTFTPTWGAGFSVDPTGDISYYDFGALVVMWTEASMLGTSDAATMLFSGVPESIRPVGYAVSVPCLVTVGGVYRFSGEANIDTDGIVTFGLSDTTTFAGQVAFTASFPTTGDKGLHAGWLIVYSK
jgi:hypothetical protein